jgi:ribosome-associated translation inhibitor RaiA
MVEVVMLPKEALDVREGAAVRVEVVDRGSNDPGAARYATKRIGPVIEQIADPVLFARVKLTHASDPARPRPDLAEVMVDIDGDIVRAQVAADGMRGAIDLLADRMRDQLQHRAERRRAERTQGGEAEPGSWRRGARPTERPPYFDRPVEEREVVSHKSFALDEITPDEAAFDMEQLDLDFYVFRDVYSGSDALLERLTDGGYRISTVRPMPSDAGPLAIRLEVGAQHPVESSVDDAVSVLDLSGAPHHFFVDRETQRGAVVYRRYDGHYGLISVAAD